MIWNFRLTNSDFGRKSRNLDKQTTLSQTIKHQRDKQILIVHRASIQLFNLYEAVNTTPR